jgi:hypothetical protein
MNINGINLTPEESDPFASIDDKIFKVQNNESQDKVSNDGAYKTGGSTSVIEHFIVAVKNLNQSTIHGHSIDSCLTDHDFKILENDGVKTLNSKDHVIISLAKHANGKVTITTHEAISETIEKKGLILHRKGPNNAEKIEDLRGKKIVYIGVNSEQYERIFSVANRMMALAAEEYLQNKKKEDNGHKHSFYNRESFYEKLDMSREWKKLVGKINNSDLAKKFKNIKNTIMESNTIEKVRKHNEEEREKKYEKRMEQYEQLDKNREIRKEYNNKREVKGATEKKEVVDDERTK